MSIKRKKPPKPRPSVARSLEEAMAEPEKCAPHTYFTMYGGLIVTVRQARRFMQEMGDGEQIASTIPALNPQFGHDGFLTTDDAELVYYLNKALEERTYRSYHLVAVDGKPVDGIDDIPEGLEPVKYTRGGTLSTADSPDTRAPDMQGNKS